MTSPRAVQTSHHDCACAVTRQLEFASQSSQFPLNGLRSNNSTGLSTKTSWPKSLLSRQFSGLPRPRLESLLASFPRLVSPTSEHTVLEASGVRFVYTPLEDIYVLLITNTQSNILLDLSTLALVTRISTELASSGRGGAIGEYDVTRVSFEILCAWDEVISLGWRENVSLQQVRSVLEMESHEEKIQEIIARNKEHEAKEELKRRAKQLEIQRRELTRRGQNPYASNSSSGFSNQNSYTPSTPAYDSTPASRSYSQQTQDDRQPAAAKPFKSKGMQLGAKGKKNENGLAEALGGLNVDDEQILLSHRQQEQDQAQLQHSAASYSQNASPAPVAPTKDANPFGQVEPQDVHLVVRESLSIELNRDGGVENFVLKGDLDLRISEPSKSILLINLPAPSSYNKSNDLQFKTHPNVDKTAWAQRGEIRLKEGKKGFPVGTGLGVLKWRMTGTDESIIPISINCWPSSDSGVCTVNLEYELENSEISLHNVLISINLPAGTEPTISDAPSQGQFSLNPDTNRLDWILDEVSVAAGTTSGSLEFEVEGDDVDAFFPVVVDFVSQNTLCGVQVLAVSTPSDNQPCDYSLDSLVTVEKYQVV